MMSGIYVTHCLNTTQSLMEKHAPAAVLPIVMCIHENYVQGIIAPLNGAVQALQDGQ